MQNANIKYLVRVEHENKEVEITMKLSEFETDWSIRDQIFHEHGISLGGWDNQAYTVIERNIELFNED